MSPVESLLFVLILFGGWLYLVIQVARNAKRRDPARAPLWCAIVLLFGPIGFIVYINARPTA